MPSSFHIVHLISGIPPRRVTDQGARIRPQEQVNERTLLLEKIVPKRLRYRDVGNAVNTLIPAVKASLDPMEHYLNDTSDARDGPWTKPLAVVVCSYYTSKAIHYRTQWTINRGEALLCCWPPGAEPIPALETFIDELLNKISRRTWSKQQSERREEFSTKVHKAVQDSVGDRKQNMFYVSGVATAPAKQHRGYASALMRMAADMADERGCATWLVSGNVQANEGFYNLFGYVTVCRFFLGDDNPDWTEPPVPIDVMIREVRSTEKKPGALGYPTTCSYQTEGAK